MRTPAQRLADLLLKMPVEQWIAEHRVTEGKRPRSWRRIAIELRDVTNGQVDVSPTTLMTWAEAGEAVSA